MQSIDLYLLKTIFRYFVPVFSNTLLQSVVVRVFCVNFFNRLRKLTTEETIERTSSR